MGINVGVIGLEHGHQNAHVQTLDASTAVDEVFIYDRDPALHDKQIATYQKVGAVYDDVDELLGRSDVPVVLVGMRTDRSPEMMERAAKAGKHVLSEKPCARTAAEMEPVVRALQENNLRFSAFYTWRYDPAIVKMRSLIEEGAIGRLTSVELRMVTSRIAVRDPKHWLFNHEIAGGGIVHWLGCHWLDLLRFVSGQEVTSVSAMVDTLSGEPIDVEDVASVSMRLSGGAIATLHASYSLPAKALGYSGPGNDTAIIFRGTEGVVSHVPPGGAGDSVVNLTSIVYPWLMAPEQKFAFANGSAPGYAGTPGLKLVEDFFRITETGGKTNLASEIDALRVLQILGAIYASAEGKREVQLEYAGCREEAR